MPIPNPYPLSTFDQGISDTFADGCMNEMPAMVTLGTGQTKIAVQAVIQSRSHARRNIQGGISAEVSGTVEIRKQDWFLAGGTLANPVSATFIGLLVTYQDGAQGRVTSAEDYGGPIITLQVGAVLQGDKGPQGGLW